MNDDIDYDKLPDTSGTVLAHRLCPAMTQVAKPAFDWLSVSSGLTTAAGLAACFIAPPVGVALLAAGIASTAMNVKHEEIEEKRDSLEGRNWREIVTALANSPNQIERGHLFLGWMKSDPSVPILIPIKPLTHHAAINGATGGGKTSRAAIPIALQLIMRGCYSVIVLNNKGTSENVSEFEIFRREAASIGIPFRFLTLNERRASHVWDPFENPARSIFSPRQYVSLLSNGFGLEHGDDYGKSFWTAVNKAPLLKGITAYPNTLSFAMLQRMLNDPLERGRLGLKKRDIQYAAHLGAIVDVASTVGVINPNPGAPEYNYRISLLEPFQRPTVLYFDLFSSVDGDTTKIISRLVIRMLTAIARVWEWPRVPVFVLYDEAQESMNRSLLTPIKQSRDSGVHFLFTYQDASDLANADVDLTGNMMTNTAVKIAYSAQDKTSREEIISTSGETSVPTQSVSRAITNTADGPIESFSEQTGERFISRITQDHINDLNRNDGDAFLLVAPNEGFSQLRRRVAIYTPHATTAEETESLRAARWPEVEPGVTVCVRDAVPFLPVVEPPPPPMEKPRPAKKPFEPKPEQVAEAEARADRMRAFINDTFKPKSGQ